MADLVLQASKRTVHGRHVRALRRTGRVPAVLYGHGLEPTTLETDAKLLGRIWSRAGRTHLVDLVVESARPKKVLIRELQIDPRTAGVLHADFFAVNLKEKLTADVPLVIIGEAPAVSDLKIGQLVQPLGSIKVECLPADLPAQLTLDVSGLAEIDAGLHVRDIELPKGVVLLHGDLDDLVVKVVQMRVQQEEPELAAAVAEPAAAPAAGEEAPAG